jgi:tetratricopeptide (TPR) repeat protein
MVKTFCAVLVFAVLAGCSGNRKSESVDLDIDNPREEAANIKPLPFALPGVPMKNELLADLPAPPAETKEPEAAVTPPAEALPAEAAPAAVQPAPAAAAGSGKDLEFHLAAAKKYSLGKKYRSAAAEYGAALPFLPAGDAREVFLLERQGAMLLKGGKDAKAQALFTSAIAKAKELGLAGTDLANAHLGLGYCLEKAKNVPEALANYEKAMALSTGKTKARIAKTISDLKKAP